MSTTPARPALDPIAQRKVDALLNQARTATRIVNDLHPLISEVRGVVSAEDLETLFTARTWMKDAALLIERLATKAGAQ